MHRKTASTLSQVHQSPAVCGEPAATLFENQIRQWSEIRATAVPTISYRYILHCNGYS